MIAMDSIKAGALDETVWYEDTDGDGYGNVASPLPPVTNQLGMLPITMIVMMEIFKPLRMPLRCATVSTTIMMAQLMSQCNWRAVVLCHPRRGYFGDPNNTISTCTQPVSLPPTRMTAMTAMPPYT